MSMIQAASALDIEEMEQDQMESDFLDENTVSVLDPLLPLHLKMQRDETISSIICQIRSRPNPSDASDLLDVLKDNPKVLEYYVMNVEYTIADLVELASKFPEYMDLFEIIPSGSIEVPGYQSWYFNQGCIETVDRILTNYPGKFSFMIDGESFKHDSNFVATMMAFLNA